MRVCRGGGDDDNVSLYCTVGDQWPEKRDRCIPNKTISVEYSNGLPCGSGTLLDNNVTAGLEPRRKKQNT